MDQRLLEKMQKITAEEQAILDGNDAVDWSIYKHNTGSVINAQKLLADGKLITVRPHTRFVHFPEHQQQILFDVVEASGADAGFTCPDLETVRKVVTRFPKAAIHYDGFVDEPTLQQIQALLQENHLIIWLPFDNDITAWCKFPKANKEMCDMAHKYGEVGVWILHEEADRQAAEAMGADIIETTGSLKP